MDTKAERERQAYRELTSIANADRQTTPLAGQWVAQVASKYVGIEDKLQRTESGSHVFRATDILAEHQEMREQFGDQYSVSLLRGPDFLKVQKDKKLFWYTFVDGDFDSRAEVKEFCRDAFSELSARARENHCAARQLRPK